jgi:hypothetical protein
VVAVLGANRIRRSCPAGCMAEVGLRWWRQWAPLYRRGDPECQRQSRSARPEHVPRPVRRWAAAAPLTQPRAKLQSTRLVQSPHLGRNPDPHRARLVELKPNRPESLPCCGQQPAQPSTQWRRQRGDSRIRSVASSSVSFVKSSALILYRRQLRPDASIGSRSCTALHR